ncbi:uncharacterized protein KY384_006568 [Bacidia gigantensis]|uniref:uncharacterized protein n=1 Tax=Bacidia gigantensis TaxID=2732470 RepID=UPI001D05A156|nr:uncharacterized protein KY384_006568 [Bacidia gigantensis]KAG8528879.1 hypothetical protein KY384_006568 [Bacidia gigantensis]
MHDKLGCDWQLGPKLAQLLAQTGKYLEQQVIPDANDNGGNSIYGFKEMFGNIPGTTIADIFQDVDEGVTETWDARTVRRPNIVCVREDVTEIAAAWNHCKAGLTTGMTADGAQDIYLCPRFWDATYPDFPAPSNCPALNVDGTDFADQDCINNNCTDGHLKINGNKWSTIIHELMHKYTPSWQTNEKYRYIDVVTGGPDFQLNNPRNYEYYANFVLAKCTKFPKGPQYTRPSRRLNRRITFSNNNWPDLEVDEEEIFVPDEKLIDAENQARVILAAINGEGNQVNT